MARTEITPNLEAIYFNLGTAVAPEWVFATVLTQLDETTNPKSVTRQYLNEKSATTIVTGFEPVHPYAIDLYTEDRIAEFIRDAIEEQKLGVNIQLCKVRLYQAIEGEADTYYARLFNVGLDGNKTSTAGEIINFSGNFNQQGDLKIGKFNTKTPTFTEASATPAAAATE